MLINLTQQEAEHLLRYNTGYLSCDHPDHGFINGSCPFYSEAIRKIKLALENEITNVKAELLKKSL